MTDVKADALENRNSPYFKANLRLWSDTEPLARRVRASGQNWTDIDVKGETIPGKGRVSARIASQHYAASEDIKYNNIESMVPVISQWLDDIERGAPPISALAKAGKIEAVIWVALFGHASVTPPDLPAELEMRAKKAGVKIFIENYTVMDDETGIPAKSFFGAKD
jgi:hypothetical protein